MNDEKRKEKIDLKEITLQMLEQEASDCDGSESEQKKGNNPVYVLLLIGLFVNPAILLEHPELLSSVLTFRAQG